MPKIELKDELFSVAQRRAMEAGYSSVDAYVCDLLLETFDDNWQDIPNLDSLFTPQRLAHIDRAAAQIEAGHGYTAEQAEAEMERRRTQWMREHHG